MSLCRTGFTAKGAYLCRPGCETLALFQTKKLFPLRSSLIPADNELWSTVADASRTVGNIGENRDDGVDATLKRSEYQRWLTARLESSGPKISTHK